MIFTGSYAWRLCCCAVTHTILIEFKVLILKLSEKGSMVCPKLVKFGIFLFVLHANSISGFWTPDWSIKLSLAGARGCNSGDLKEYDMDR